LGEKQKIVSITRGLLIRKIATSAFGLLAMTNLIEPRPFDFPFDKLRIRSG
jgi:hypothetical protein